MQAETQTGTWIDRGRERERKRREWEREKERKRERERERDRQIDRQIDRQTDRWIDRQIYGHCVMQHTYIPAANSHINRPPNCIHHTHISPTAFKIYT